MTQTSPPLPPRRRTWSVLVALCPAVVATSAAPALASRGLPRFEEDRSGCYRTDAMLPHVACDGAVPHAIQRELFHNLASWSLLSLPFMGVTLPIQSLGPMLAGLVAWGSILLLPWAAWRTIRGR